MSFIFYSFEKFSYSKVGQTCWGSWGTILVVWFHLWSLSPIFGTNCFRNLMTNGVNAPLGKVNVVIHKDMDKNLHQDQRTWSLSQLSSHSLKANSSCKVSNAWGDHFSGCLSPPVFHGYTEGNTCFSLWSWFTHLFEIDLRIIFFWIYKLWHSLSIYHT